MKARDSGMPEERMWASFFDVDFILDQVLLQRPVETVVEFGCGYGTFTIPAARRTIGVVHAIDIETDMVAATCDKARAAGLTNVQGAVRDFVADGTGLDAGSADYAMLFNILHLEDPLRLLAEAHRVLRPGGRLGIIHWNYDPSTPRGPDMAIRPRPEQCLAWAISAGFAPLTPIVALPPYHYGFAVRRIEPVCVA